MEINTDKSQLMIVSRSNESLQNKVNKRRRRRNVLTKNCYCTREIKMRIAITKEKFNRKVSLLTSKLNIKLRKKLVRCYVWSIAFYGSETWTPRKFECKYLESFGIWCRRRMEKIKWSEKVTNEQALEREGGKKTLLNNIQRRKAKWIGHICGLQLPMEPHRSTRLLQLTGR